MSDFILPEAVVILAVIGGVTAALITRSERRSRLRDKEWLEKAQIVQGVIYRYSASPPGSEDEVFEPVIRFTASNGCEYEFKGQDASYSPGEVGVPVMVAYDPELPSSARELNPQHRDTLLGTVLFLCFAAGALFIVAALLSELLRALGWHFLTTKGA